MERGRRDDDGCSSQHNTMWKQFQARAKPLLSPKLGSRDPDERKERGGWMFRKMKRKETVVLDRVISSSQPDLLFSSRVDCKLKGAQLCGGDADSCSGGSRDKLPTLACLVQSHHKSSSLGSACLDGLSEAPGGGSGGGEAAGAQLGSGDEQPVSLTHLLADEMVPGDFMVKFGCRVRQADTHNDFIHGFITG